MANKTMENLLSKFRPNYGSDQKETKKKDKKQFATFVKINDSTIAEQVVIGDIKQFLVYDHSNDRIAVHPTLLINGKTIYPLDSELVDKKTILFPEEAVEYHNLETLQNEIINYIHKYVDIPEFYEKLASYYILLTWLFDKNTVVTYLGIHGDFGSGKTRTIQIIGSLCYKQAMVSGSVTCAPIYRIMELARGTLVINEFDFDNSDMGQELIKILNNGYEKNMSVLRMQAKGDKILAFDAFGPKIFAYRQKKKDEAFQSRLITIKTSETKRDDIPVSLPPEYTQEAMAIRNKLLMFRFRNYFDQVTVDLSIFTGVDRRLRQTLYPLLTVIKDPTFISSLKQFIREIQADVVAERASSWLADYIQAIIDASITSKEITVKMATDAYNNNKEVQEHVENNKFSNVIKKHLGLTTRRLSGGKEKGRTLIVIDTLKFQALCTKYSIQIPKESSLSSPHSLPDQDKSESSEYSEDSTVLEGEVANPCDICGGSDYWVRSDGYAVCSKCHPQPARTTE